MKKLITLCCALLTMLMGWIADANAETIPTIKWQKSFGGTGFDGMVGAIETPDGGYILGGFIEVGSTTHPFLSPIDYYLVKLDSTGKKQWQKFFGGDSEDILSVFEKTQDGGYILGGRSYSGISRDKTTPNVRGEDIWIIKLDENFNVEWDRSFGTIYSDLLVSLQQTSDGGYVLGGREWKDGPNDFWAIKLNAQGQTQWNRHYGGDDYDVLSDLKQTHDGGYILAGHSRSNISGDKTSPSLGGSDAWLVKLDKDGLMQWEKSYGGSTDDIFDSVEQTDDGGFILSGAQGESFNGVTWVVRLDSAGTLLWEKRLGPTDDNFNVPLTTSEIQQTPDDGYILVALEKEEYTDVPDGSRVVKLSSDGNEQWRTKFGGDFPDKMINFRQTSDGSLIMTGLSNSGISGDKTSPNHGGYDGWVLKLESRFFINASATDSGAGTIQVEPPQPIDGYEAGTAVTLTATPSGTNIFFGWTGSANSSSNQITVVINYDIAMTAHFSDSLLLWQHADGRSSTWFMDNTNCTGALVLNNGQKLPHWRLVAAHHFNNDASKDLLLQDAQGRLAVRYMDGNHLVTSIIPPAQIIGTSGLNWKAVGAGDFNSDSRTDILFKNTSNRLAVRLMDGTNYTTVLLNHGNAVGADWRVVTVCDFNANGHSDILFQHRDGRIAIWFMNGVERQTAELVKRNGSVVNVGSTWRLVSATRVNADDQSDLLFQHVDGRIAVWYMDGTTHSSSAFLNDGRPVNWRLQAVK